MAVPLPTQLKIAGLPAPESEFQFAPPRKWAFDLAWPGRLLAVEVEGGTWKGGRHVRPKGYEDDCEKYSEAAVLGWRLLRVTTAMVADGRALALVRRALELPGGGGQAMLVLSRKLGEKIHIGDDVVITVVDIDRGKIRLGIEAPRSVKVYRQELLPEGDPRRPRKEGDGRA